MAVASVTAYFFMENTDYKKNIESGRRITV